MLLALLSVGEEYSGMIGERNGKEGKDLKEQRILRREG